MIMLPIILGREGDRIKIEVTVDLSGGMLEAEETILRAVNAVGNVATTEALKRFDADGDPIVVGGSVWYSKGKLPKIFNTPYGVVSVERHVYQPAEGGKTFCPMDDGARVIRKATPRFAKIVSHKFARGAAAEVVEDLEQNHGRPCLKASLQDLATHVGTVVQTKEESWSYATPQIGRVTTVGIGIDGTCMLICDQKWREAMTGSISLYDKHGERLHTIYLGAAPEYGKETFFARMQREIEHVKSLYPNARFVGIADGAKSNWHFLGPHIDEQVLDFYHATQYLARAASAIWRNEAERQQWLDEQCHNLKHKHHAAARILRDLEQAITTKMKPDQRKDLQDCVTYFGNHLHQMRYARYIENGIPIGSGVTEAACKTLVKQRLCCSGMRWTPEGAQIVLSLRALALTESRWEQFWQMINQYGVPQLLKHQ
jgi:hypothetical protein